MILVKNSNFLHCLFLLKIGPKKVFGGVLDNKNMSFLKIGPEMMFGDVLDRKEAFRDNKNMYLICPKNRKFSKGVKP